MTEHPPPPQEEGPRVIGFNSAEEMFAYMDEEERKANEQVHPRQKEVSYGSYFWRYVDYVPCHIFGYVYTVEELFLLERQHGADPEEAEFVLRGKEASHKRGYRYGMCYSRVEPEGELGDTHIVNVWPITKEEFEEAKANRWQPPTRMIQRIMDEMMQAQKDMQ